MPNQLVRHVSIDADDATMDEASSSEEQQAPLSIAGSPDRSRTRSPPAAHTSLDRSFDNGKDSDSSGTGSAAVHGISTDDHHDAGKI